MEEINFTFDFPTGPQDATDDTEQNYGLSLRQAQIIISDLTPVIAITSPTTKSNYTEGKLVTFIGAATDNEDEDLSSLIE